MKEGGRGKERRALRSSHEDIDMSSSLPLHSLLLLLPSQLISNIQPRAQAIGGGKERRGEEDAGKTANV